MPPSDLDLSGQILHRSLICNDLDLVVRLKPHNLPDILIAHLSWVGSV